jgi:hypothetical protein
MKPLNVGDRVTILNARNDRPHIEACPRVLVDAVIDAEPSDERPDGKVYTVVHEVVGDWEPPRYGPYPRTRLNSGW